MNHDNAFRSPDRRSLFRTLRTASARWTFTSTRSRKIANDLSVDADMSPATPTTTTSFMGVDADDEHQQERSSSSRSRRSFAKITSKSQLLLPKVPFSEPNHDDDIDKEDELDVVYSTSPRRLAADEQDDHLFHSSLTVSKVYVPAAARPKQYRRRRPVGDHDIRAGMNQQSQSQSVYSPAVVGLGQHLAKRPTCMHRSNSFTSQRSAATVGHAVDERHRHFISKPDENDNGDRTERSRQKLILIRSKMEAQRKCLQSSIHTLISGNSVDGTANGIDSSCCSSRSKSTASSSASTTGINSLAMDTESASDMQSVATADDMSNSRILDAAQAENQRLKERLKKLEMDNTRQGKQVAKLQGKTLELSMSLGERQAQIERMQTQMLPSPTRATSTTTRTSNINDNVATTSSDGYYPASSLFMRGDSSLPSIASAAHQSNSANNTAAALIQHRWEMDPLQKSPNPKHLQKALAANDDNLGMNLPNNDKDPPTREGNESTSKLTSYPRNLAFAWPFPPPVVVDPLTTRLDEIVERLVPDLDSPISTTTTTDTVVDTNRKPSVGCDEEEQGDSELDFDREKNQVSVDEVVALASLSVGANAQQSPSMSTAFIGAKNCEEELISKQVELSTAFCSIASTLMERLHHLETNSRSDATDSKDVDSKGSDTKELDKCKELFQAMALKQQQIMSRFEILVTNVREEAAQQRSLRLDVELENQVLREQLSAARATTSSSSEYALDPSVSLNCNHVNDDDDDASTTAEESDSDDDILCLENSGHAVECVDEPNAPSPSSTAMDVSGPHIKSKQKKQKKNSGRNKLIAPEENSNSVLDRKARLRILI